MLFSCLPIRNRSFNISLTQSTGSWPRGQFPLFKTYICKANGRHLFESIICIIYVWDMININIIDSHLNMQQAQLNFVVLRFSVTMPIIYFWLLSISYRQINVHVSQQLTWAPMIYNHMNAVKKKNKNNFLSTNRWVCPSRDERI